MTRELVEEMEISQEEFQRLASDVCERIASGMKGPLAPKDVLPVLNEIAFGIKNPEEIELPKNI